MKIKLYYATILGTSQMVCEDILEAMGEDYDFSLSDIMHLSVDDLNQDAFFVFVSSTTGHGEMPESALDFVEEVRERKPNLSGLKFAIFGLGDQGYADTFNMGSQRLLELLKEHGAIQIGERGIFDASSGEMPEDIAIPWLGETLKAYENKNVAGND